MKWPIIIFMLALHLVHKCPVQASVIPGPINMIITIITTGKTVNDWMEERKAAQLAISTQEELMSFVKDYSLQLPRTLHSRRELNDVTRLLGHVTTILTDATIYLEMTKEDTHERDLADQDFFEKLTVSLPEKLNIIYSLVFPDTKVYGELPELLPIIGNQKNADRPMVCGDDSPRKLAFKLYRKFMFAEMFSFIYAKMAFERESKHTGASAEVALSMYREAAVKRLRRYTTTIEENLQKISMEIKTCDPKEWIDEGNYYYLSKAKYINIWDNPSPGKYLSLQWEKTDTRDNKVITGIRFNRRHSMLYINIREGKLGPNLTITDESWTYGASMDYQKVNAAAEWRAKKDKEIRIMPLDAYVYGGSSAYDAYAEATIVAMLNEFEAKNASHPANRQPGEIVLGLDFADIQPRTDFFLDDITFPVDHAVTGVRFKYARHNIDVPGSMNRGWYLTLEVEAMKFDRNTGVLDKENPIIKTAKPVGPRLIFHNDRCHVEDLPKGQQDPLKSDKRNIEDAPNNTMLRLKYNTVDGSKKERFMTYFDGTDLETHRPISGLGLFHKSNKDCSGGFLALRVFDMDHVYYFPQPSILE